MAPEPEALVQVAAIVAGAGLAGTVQGLVKGVVPQLAPEIGGAVVGGALYYFGDRVHPLVKALGVGILAGSLAPMISKAVPSIAPAGATAPIGAAPAPTTAAAAAAVARYTISPLSQIQTKPYLGSYLTGAVRRG